MDTLDSFFNNTTSQFYVVLTGTSSLLSGVMMFFEWLHYTYFGISIVDRLVSLVLHIFPFLNGSKNKDGNGKTKKGAEAKPFRNSLVLFRGAEYNRFFDLTGKQPLTEYNVSLTAVGYLSFFTFEGMRLENDSDEDLMVLAWSKAKQEHRVSLARSALEVNPQCASAMILLAEEEAPSILEVEEQMKLALKSAEVAYRNSLTLSQQDPVYKPLHERNANLCTYARIRIAACARKLGKVKEASKMYRDLFKDDRAPLMASVLENLVECLLETQSYSEVQQVLSKQEDVSLIKSTVMCYTIALLKSKVVGEKFCPDLVSKRGPTPSEMAAIDSIHRAVELNPHVPKYLLELKSLILPPEHIFKRGDSEALAYAFHHIHHWKRVEGALTLLASTWEGTFRRIPFPLERGHLFHPYPAHAEVVDRQLLPSYHEMSVYPHRETPFFMVFTGVLCFSFMSLTVIAYHFPSAMTQYAKTVTTVFLVVLEKLVPTDIFGIL